MTLEQLTTFLWVARLNGVRRAAEQMNLSQPAVSARIAALEDSLRVTLFDRGPGGVTLTARGEMLLAYAEQILETQERIREHVVDARELEGVLRVGVSETIVQAWLPQFVTQLNRDYPGLNVEVTVDISLNLREALLARALDLALLMGPISEYSVNNIELPEFSLGWFRPTDLTEVDLTTTPVISYARNTRPYRELKTELTRRYGPGLRLFPSTSLSACFQMVAGGLGVGALPRALAQKLLDEREIAEFDPGWHPPPLRFTASYLGEPYSFVAERSAEIAFEVARRHTQSLK